MIKLLTTCFAYGQLTLKSVFKKLVFSAKKFFWKHQWRLNLLQRRAQRAWRQFSIVKFFTSFLAAQRWLWLLLAAIVALWLFGWIIGGQTSSLTLALEKFRELLLGVNNTNEANRLTNTGAWSMLALIVGSPVAFALWKFRDTNTLWQIENARKDTNLKDFQKLTEWVSGLHLIEDTLSTSLKTSPNLHNEQTEARETTQIPQAATLATITKREGSVSLQIAAIYQLQGFLRGDFGQQFQRPAFVLLKTVWLSLMQAHKDEWVKNEYRFVGMLSQPDSEEKNNSPEMQEYEKWLKNIKTTANTPLAQAINQAWVDKHGAVLRSHASDLPLALFAGISAHSLELDGLNLEQIQLQSANLRQAQLQGADLRWAQLQGANLSHAQLQGADLSGAQLQGADLSGAQLQGANLDMAVLQGGNLICAQLQGANLNGVHLQSANLNKAELRGVTVINPHFNEHTRMHSAKCDASTRFVVGYSMANIILESTHGFRFKLSAKLIPEATHALRLKLRDDCGLSLAEEHLTEFATQWAALPKTTQSKTYQLVGTKQGYANTIQRMLKGDLTQV